MDIYGRSRLTLYPLQFLLRAYSLLLPSVSSTISVASLLRYFELHSSFYSLSFTYCRVSAAPINVAPPICQKESNLNPRLAIIPLAAQGPC
ncbi:unnamed protein product [Ectocarpus sp. CCAP 1310/34]|nr:unnamed protein product [Ectocarpus sp. CCAP 1310/34]